MNFDRVCFEMAAKGEAGCSLVKDEELKDEFVALCTELLHGEGFETQDIGYIAERQPFRLRLMEKLLERAADPDHKFLLQGEAVIPLEFCSHCRARHTCMRSR